MLLGLSLVLAALEVADGFRLELPWMAWFYAALLLGGSVWLWRTKSSGAVIISACCTCSSSSCFCSCSVQLSRHRQLGCGGSWCSCHLAAASQPGRAWFRGGVLRSHTDAAGVLGSLTAVSPTRAFGPDASALMA